MEQMNVEESVKIQIDFTEELLPKSAKKLQPLVWKDTDSFSCLLGPDKTSGVFGSGETPLLAIIDWDTHLTTHLAEAKQDDQVIQYVKDVYKADNTEVW